MSLDDLLKQSEEDRKKDSLWISTALGEEGEVLCQSYIGEEIQKTDKGEQLVVSVMANGKEMKLGRPYPFSPQTEEFIVNLIKVSKTPPFIIRKVKGKKWAEYYAVPAKI